ncbi:MAG: hypothetical protein ACTSVY_15715 [Candidatus Helarchaeota archaeon]
MGRKKKKKKESSEEKNVELSENEINVEEDKQLFADIFGVSLDEIEEESEDDTYDDILEDLDDIHDEMIEEKKTENLENIGMIEDDVVSQALETLTEKIELKSIPGIQEEKVIPLTKPILVEAQKPQSVKPSVIKPQVPKHQPIQPQVIKKIVQKPESVPMSLNIPPPPRVKKFQKPIQAQQDTIINKVQTQEVPIKQKTESKLEKDKITLLPTEAPGVVRPISFGNTDTNLKKTIPKTIKVIEPKSAFKTAELFIEKDEVSVPDEKKKDLSDIRCGNCGKRITKEAEASLKEGWIINCEHCGHQIII